MIAARLGGTNRARRYWRRREDPGLSFTAYLSLAFVMVAGPQILSSIFLATSESWRSS